MIVGILKNKNLTTLMDLLFVQGKASSGAYMATLNIYSVLIYFFRVVTLPTLTVLEGSRYMVPNLRTRTLL